MSTSQRFGTGQSLLDLLLDPVDPGYRAATERRRAAGLTRRWYDRPAVAIGCLLIGFTLAFAYAHTHRAAPQTATVHNSLVGRARGAERDANSLAGQVAALSTQVNRARDAVLAGSGALQNELYRQLAQASQTAVSGPGLLVTLADPKARVVLSDQDVRGVVNELWADGAQAITVDDVRLTPTSAIRFAGQVVLVDFQPVASPYVIRATGDKDMLATHFASSQVAASYATRSSAEGFGFRFDEQSSMSLPAGAPVTLRYAQQSGGSR